MFTVQDMMEMVKQGYKTEEITKLYEIGKEIENPAGAADTGSTGESSGAENETAEIQKETGAETGTESGDPEPAGSDVDWKKKAEEMTEKYEAFHDKYNHCDEGTASKAIVDLILEKSYLNDLDK